MNFRTRSAGLACVAVAALSLSACGGSSHPKKSPTPTIPVPVTTPATSASPTPKPPPPVNPLTGLKPNINYVVAAKIDDTANGRPQLGIDKADIVYIEEVEGGLTRLLAVFNSSLPTIEAVRSTRAGDPEVLAQYGPIAYVASGGARNPLAVLDKSNLKSDINDRGGPGFQRDGNRPAPYNLKANLAQIAKIKKGAKAKNIGFTWSASLPNKSVAGTRVSTRVGGTPVRFDWNPKLKQYVRVINGNVQHTATGKTISTPNVIVQFCKVTVYRQDTDVMGNPNMYTHTIGTGKAAVFRDGHRVSGTWSRPKATSGTVLRDASGKQIPLAPGGAWVVLVATNAPLS
jgi:hypothetical protein